MFIEFLNWIVVVKDGKICWALFVVRNLLLVNWRYVVITYGYYHRFIVLVPLVVQSLEKLSDHFVIVVEISHQLNVMRQNITQEENQFNIFGEDRLQCLFHQFNGNVARTVWWMLFFAQQNLSCVDFAFIQQCQPAAQRGFALGLNQSIHPLHLVNVYVCDHPDVERVFLYCNHFVARSGMHRLSLDRGNVVPVDALLFRTELWVANVDTLAEVLEVELIFEKVVLLVLLLVLEEVERVLDHVFVVVVIGVVHALADEQFEIGADIGLQVVGHALALNSVHEWLAHEAECVGLDEGEKHVNT